MRPHFYNYTPWGALTVAHLSYPKRIFLARAIICKLINSFIQERNLRLRPPDGAPCERQNGREVEKTCKISIGINQLMIAVYFQVCLSTLHNIVCVNIRISPPPFSLQSIEGSLESWRGGLRHYALVILENVFQQRYLRDGV